MSEVVNVVCAGHTLTERLPGYTIAVSTAAFKSPYALWDAAASADKPFARLLVATYPDKPVVYYTAFKEVAGAINVRRTPKHWSVPDLFSGEGLPCGGCSLVPTLAYAALLADRVEVWGADLEDERFLKTVSECVAMLRAQGCAIRWHSLEGRIRLCKQISSGTT